MGVEEDAAKGAFILSQRPQARGANATMSAREEDDVAWPIEADHTIPVLSIFKAVNSVDLERSAARFPPRAEAPFHRHDELPRDCTCVGHGKLAAPVRCAGLPVGREDEYR